MYNLSRDLALPCAFLHQSYNPKKTFLAHSIVDKDSTISKEAIDFFNDHGISITSVELFYRRPSPQWGIVHIDNDGSFDRLNINFVIGGDDSVMGWFKTKTLDAGYTTVGDTGAVPRRYHSSEVELIHTASIKQPSLIQGGVPHAILNTKKQRWCVCANIRDSKTQHVVTWDLARDRLEKYFI